MKTRFRRTLSIVLSIAMLVSMTGMNTVFAAAGNAVLGLSGLCEHHSEHTDDCFTGEPVCNIMRDTGVTTDDTLIAALKSATPATINMTDDITIKGSASLLMVTMGADHTLNISDGKTLTIGGGTGNNDAALINLNGHTLTVNGGAKGKVLINNFGSNGIYGNPGTLNLENVQVEVTNSIQNGLGNIQILNIKDGATVTLNGDGNSLMCINDGQTVTVESGGSVTITKGYISLHYGNLHINGGAVHVNSGPDRGIWTSDGSTLKLSGGGTLDGTGTIALYKGFAVEGLGGKFTDRGAKLTESGVVTVGMPSVSPAASGLTQGDYIWDESSNTFSKSGYTVSGTVKDSRGNGISGAAVTLEYLYLATAYVAGTVTTDADGSYTFSNVSASFYSIGVDGKTYDKEYCIKASKDGYAEIAGELFSVADNDVTGQDITLTAGGGTTTYAVTVTNGTGTGEYEAGATITVTADAPQTGKRFKQWTATGLTDSTYTTNPLTFQMPAGAVALTAVYEDISVDTSAIDTAISAANAAKTGITTSDSSASSVANGTKFVTTAEMKALNDAISAAQAAKGTVTTTAQAQAAAQTLDAATAAFKAAIKTGTYTGGSSGGGSSGGGGGATTKPPTVTAPDATKPNTPTDAKTEVKATVDSTGKATATVPEKSVTDALKAAQDTAKKNGTEKNGISVTLDLKTDKAASSIAATLPQNAIAELTKAGVTELKIESSTGDIRLDLATLKAIQAAGGDNVTVSMNKADVKGLSAEAQKAIGNRPVFDLSITAGGKTVTDFGGGQVSVGLPYTAAANENPGNLFGVYVDNRGKVTYLVNSSYDTNAKMLCFATSHFSTFGIGYKAPIAFTDTKGHWAEKDIAFVVNRGMFSGASATTFSPNTGMTRGMFVTALGRLAGIDSTKYKITKFSDVAADAYYAPYVAWAAEVGITSGTSATTFSPDKTIIRQELATLMVNYAKVMKYTLPQTREAVTFADADSIGSFAKDAVKAMQMAGVMNGKDGDKFDPTGTATRAEAAATLHRYAELIINPATAQGLDTNDSGSAAK